MTTTTPIAPRRYNVQEIDQMREAIEYLLGAHIGGGKHLRELVDEPDDIKNIQSSYYKSVWLPYSLNDGKGTTGWDQVEDRLRTYMMGGVSAASLKKEAEKKQKELQAEVDKKNQYMKVYEMNKSLQKLFKVGKYVEKV